MSYLCGLGPGLGVEARDPQIRCDGCAAAYYLPTDRAPPSWFLGKKAPPRWKRNKRTEEKRQDWCPECRVKGRQ